MGVGNAMTTARTGSVLLSLVVAWACAPSTGPDPTAGKAAAGATGQAKAPVDTKTPTPKPLGDPSGDPSGDPKPEPTTAAPPPSTPDPDPQCLSTKISGLAAGPGGKAAAPYETCSANITMHVADPSRPGERGGLSGFDFNVDATKTHRDTASDLCCYGSGEADKTSGKTGHRRDGVTCMTAVESQSAAKPHRDAEAPFAACAAGVASHTEDPARPGERGGLSSTAFSVENTTSARAEALDICCYG